VFLKGLFFFLSLFFVSGSFAWGVEVKMEALGGEGVWVSPLPKVKEGEDFAVTVWFEEQFLGDGAAYDRRAKEFGKVGREELRVGVIKELKKANEESMSRAKEKLDDLVKEGLLRELRGHWVVNGFSVKADEKGVEALKEVPGVRKVFVRELRRKRVVETEGERKIPQLARREEVSFEDLPWYVKRLEADRVWREFGVAGKGTLNVIHDKNFIMSAPLARSVYRNEKEVPGNGVDDDGNGYVDDVHGYNFDGGNGRLWLRDFSGDLKEKGLLHGTNCANIVSGAGDDAEGDKRRGQFGVAPLSQWAGVINLGGIERSVEWAIEQGADTYSMSFTRAYLGEYASHWRKVMEHGSFCGVCFVSGAGNRRNYLPEPFLMHVPQSIPRAVFAASGVQRDLSKAEFSCVGPVFWETEHYQDGEVQKPEVCAFNQGVAVQFPDGKVMESFLNGNSYAGPMFCGAISLMLSADPDLLPWDLQEIIMKTARDVGPKGVDFETGHGLIDCYEAVKEVLRRKKMREGEVKKLDVKNEFE